jgi:transposase InsO family protein
LRLWRDGIWEANPGSDANRRLEVYLNLARRMKLTAINQLWVADMTYIRLRGEFVYLALVLDAFSRRVVGWALQRNLTARLPMLALERAITARQPGAGLVHHSDRGVQYASEQYTRLLRSQGMLPSMSRPANPYDNAACESFIKTLKREEIYAHRYRDLDDLHSHIEEFIDRYYNRLRLHSALGYTTPQEFEAACATQAAGPPPTVSFSRHGEIYRCNGNGDPVEPGPPPHPIDEFPTGYSLTGWSPPEPVSASPAAIHSDGEP